MSNQCKSTSNCRANFQCVQHPCPNSWWCNDVGISWEIPYVRTPEALIVKEYAPRYEPGKKRYNYTDMYYGTYPLNSDEYATVEDTDGTSGYYNDMRSYIEKSWQLAGWCAAVPVKQGRKQHEHDEDDIFF
jgi:hypothetical protein